MRYNHLGRTGLLASEFCFGIRAFGRKNARFLAARNGIARLRQQHIAASITLGVRSAEQVDANLTASEMLPADGDMRALDDLGALEAGYPEWMFQRAEDRATLPSTGVLAEQTSNVRLDD